MYIDPVEQNRLEELKSFAILDTPPEDDFDHLTQLAASVCETPISLVTLIDEERQWFKSMLGMDIRETSRDDGFCIHAIHSHKPLIVEDAYEDLRFAQSPMVTGNPFIRFYAGVPLVTANGHVLGTLCVADRIARTLSGSQLHALNTLAAQVVMQFELRRHQRELQNLVNERGWMNATLLQQTNLLREAQRIAEVGSWDLQIDEKKLSWSDEVYRIFGRDQDNFQQTFESFLSAVHPDDCVRLLKAQELALKQIKPLDIEHRIVRPNGDIRHVQEKGQLVFSDADAKLHFIGTVQDITEKKIVEETLSALADNLTATLESITDAFLTLDLEWRFRYINKEAERLLQSSSAEIMGKIAWQEFKEFFGEKTLQEFNRARQENITVEFEKFYDTLERWFEIRVYPSKAGLAVYYRDITERKRTELELARLNRALRMLSACNEALIHAANEVQLLSNICRLAVEVGGYRTAWVGYAQENDERTIVPMAFSGNEKDAAYISKLKISGRADHSHASSAFCSVALVENIDEQVVDAADHMIDHHGVLCLPLRDNNQMLGVLALYAEDACEVTDAESKLLKEMADDLAFGITNIRSLHERGRIQSAMMKVAASVSANTGTAFFEQLILNMVEALGADAGYVARLHNSEKLAAHTLVSIVDGDVRENFTYSLSDTPCAHLIHADDYVIQAELTDNYPASAWLRDLNAEAYVGGRLLNSSGQPIGLIFALFRQPLKNTDFIKSTLQIFATRAAAELERQESDSRLREQAALLDKAQDAIIVLGIDHRIQFWSKGAERVYGWTAQEALGLQIENILQEDVSHFEDAISCVKDTGEWNGEILQRKKDGSKLIVEGRWTLVLNDKNEPQSILAINTDITQRRAAADEIQHLAFYDVLTGLPNRQLLRNRLQHLLAMPRRVRRSGALLFIDLDNFKTLNDTFGHDKGDLLLQEVAKRLVTCVRKSDTVARLGGDEFVVLLGNLNEDILEAAAEAKVVGEKILYCFSEPFQLASYPYHTTPSIGITLFDEQPHTVDELLKRADIAMYQAKGSGKNSLRFFDPEMEAVVTAKVEMESDLRQAFKLNQFSLHYQPQVDRKGNVTGAEALLRWKHPQRGFISPADFIPVAEETGLIIPLGKWVIETACNQLAHWASKPETQQLSMAVNVSARQFRHLDFVNQVYHLLEITKANPKLLKLELTESLLLENVEDTVAKMTALKNKGVGFSLDDFGTGYSSLSYLKRLPLDQLKIDQSFVRDVLTDPNDTVIVQTIIALGKSLGLEVIAEGVETCEQRDFLASHECHAHQGYYFSRPLPIESFEEYTRGQLSGQVAA